MGTSHSYIHARYMLYTRRNQKPVSFESLSKNKSVFDTDFVFPTKFFRSLFTICRLYIIAHSKLHKFYGLPQTCKMAANISLGRTILSLNIEHKWPHPAWPIVGQGICKGIPATARGQLENVFGSGCRALHHTAQNVESVVKDQGPRHGQLHGQGVVEGPRAGRRVENLHNVQSVKHKIGRDLKKSQAIGTSRLFLRSSHIRVNLCYCTTINGLLCKKSSQKKNSAGMLLYLFGRVFKK